MAKSLKITELEFPIFEMKLFEDQSLWQIHAFELKITE